MPFSPYFLRAGILLQNKNVSKMLFCYSACSVICERSPVQKCKSVPSNSTQKIHRILVTYAGEAQTLVVNGEYPRDSDEVEVTN